MATCPVCNKELIEGSKFCDGCGAQIFEQIFCPNCGQQTSTEFAFCQNCGASIVEQPAAGQPQQQPIQNPIVASKPKKKIPKKAFVFGAVGIVVIAAIVLAIILFGGKGKSKINYAMYVKDKQIFFTDLKKNSEAWQLTSNLFDSDGFDAGEMADEGHYLGLYTFVSDDGKYVFYPDKLNEDDEGFNLYYREANKPEAEPIKIDSEVGLYMVNTSTTLVTYIKTDGRLYQYKIKDDAKDKIASEVDMFSVSSDGNRICYATDDDSLYLKIADKDKELIASDISNIVDVNDDVTKIYYLADGSLYKKFDGEEKTKIASDVSSVIKVYESGEVYYVKGDSEEVPLMNYVTDDMKDADAAMTEPEYPDYPDSPSWWDYETDAEYEAAYEAYSAAYDAAYAAYEEAYDAYWKKEMRDELRADLAEETIEKSSYTLCYFNGKEETVITDAYSSYSGSAADEAAVITYSAYNQSEFENVKLSEIESLYDVEDMVTAALYASTERYIAVKETATVIEQQKEAACFILNSSGTALYYIDDIPDEEYYGELYRVSISNGSVGTPEVYDSGVYTGSYRFIDDDQFLYFKDYNDGKGEMYINKEKIDFDVYPSYVGFIEDENKLYYYTDYNFDKNQGTLKVYQNKEVIKIADDVHNFTRTPEGQILYLTNYSTKSYKSELYMWDKKEPVKLDDDVLCILPVYDMEIRGEFFDEW